VAATNMVTDLNPALNTSGTTTQQRVTKLTFNSAKSLLAQEAVKAGYVGELSKEDVQIFMDKYNEQASKQMEEVVASTKTTTTGSGATTADRQNAITNTIQTQYPSYFDANTFAQDFIWSKVDFGPMSKNLGGKALDAITKVREIVNDSGAYTVSLVEMQNYARQVGKGTLSTNDLTAMLNKKAAFDYPQLADRLSDTPGATVKSLVQPYIKLIADTLEIPEGSVELNNPYLEKMIRPDGTAGKVPMMSIYDAKQMLMKTPDFEKTSAANGMARDAAISLGKALGAGL